MYGLWDDDDDASGSECVDLDECVTLHDVVAAGWLRVRRGLCGDAARARRAWHEWALLPRRLLCQLLDRQRVDTIYWHDDDGNDAFAVAEYLSPRMYSITVGVRRGTSIVRDDASMRAFGRYWRNTRMHDKAGVFAHRRSELIDCDDESARCAIAFELSRFSVAHQQRFIEFIVLCSFDIAPN